MAGSNPPSASGKAMLRDESKGILNSIQLSLVSSSPDGPSSPFRWITPRRFTFGNRCVRALLFSYIAMIAVAVFSLIRGDIGTSENGVSKSRRVVGCVATFILAVYGGLFSGGYVTMLTAVFVFFFGLTFLQSVATTKVISLFCRSLQP